MAEAHLPHGEDHGAHTDVHHETTDVNVSGVLLFGAGLFVVAVIVHLLVWLLFGYFSGREAIRGGPEYPLAASEQNRLPPEPRLQINPREDLRELRSHEDHVVHRVHDQVIDPSVGHIAGPVHGRTPTFRTFVSFVSLVSLVSFVSSAPQALSAQITGAPAVGYKHDPGAPSSTMPAALR